MKIITTDNFTDYQLFMIVKKGTNQALKEGFTRIRTWKTMDGALAAFEKLPAKERDKFEVVEFSLAEVNRYDVKVKAVVSYDVQARKK
jgi:hypothetical protein